MDEHCKIHMRQLVLCLGLLLTMTACALPDLRLHSYADYLNEAVGHADHDTVAKHMGAPKRRAASDKGGDLWTYEICVPSRMDALDTASSTGTVSSRPGYCQSLNLVFDDSGKLAEWHETRVQ